MSTLNHPNTHMHTDTGLLHSSAHAAPPLIFISKHHYAGWQQWRFRRGLVVINRQLLQRCNESLFIWDVKALLSLVKDCRSPGRWGKMVEPGGGRGNRRCHHVKMAAVRELTQLHRSFFWTDSFSGFGTSIWVDLRTMNFTEMKTLAGGHTDYRTGCVSSTGRL